LRRWIDFFKRIFWNLGKILIILRRFKKWAAIEENKSENTDSSSDESEKLVHESKEKQSIVISQNNKSILK
jgi:hypothetical protein